jgi:hypothetical protein
MLPGADGYIISDKDRAAQSFRELRPRLEQVQRTEGWCEPSHPSSGDAGGAADGSTAPSPAGESTAAVARPLLETAGTTTSVTSAPTHPPPRPGEAAGVDFVVLGTSGFLGSATLRELQRQGYSVAT